MDGVCILFVDLLLEVRLGHLIRCPTPVSVNEAIPRRRGQNIPANGCTRHGRDNPGPHASEETRPAELTLDDGGGIKQTAHGANLFALGEAAGLEEGLHDVERGGDTGGEGTGETAGHAVGERVVFHGGVHHLREGLVRDELGGGEGHGHAESGRIGDVEGLETLGAVNGFGALHKTLVNRPVDLHPLLDD